ncbi:MAG: TonB-dependent receptor [Gammaproteobacteria bacterium]
MKRICIITVGIALTTPLAAWAQDAASLDEIVVTAQRREQNLQEVPISITAFTGEQLEKSNIKGAVDYLAQTPNVSFTEDAQSGSRGLGISIRGVNNLVSGENAFVNSVGIYLDEFSVASVPNGVANPFLPDMERVEVLRGPQGTYFGRNSLGGALNLVTRAPTDKYEGQVTLGTESYEDAGEMYNITGTFNAPVTDKFKLRGTAFYEDSSGLVKNINPSGANDSGHKWINLRLRGELEATDSTRLGFTVIYAKEEQGTDETVPSGVLDLDTVDTFGFQPGVAFDPGTGFFPQNQNKLSHDLDESNDLRTTIGIVNFAHDISDQLTWKAVAGVIDAKQDRLFDNDLIGNLDVLSRTNQYEGKSWSVETRLESRTATVDWTVGAMYAQDDQDQFNNVAVSSNPTAMFDGVGFLPPFPPGLGLARNTKNFHVDSVAAFADATWHVNEKLDLTAGARYTTDDVENSRTSFGTAPTQAGGPGPGFFESFVNFARPEAHDKRSFNDVTPRAVLRYKWTDAASGYVTVSKGYKAGGASTGNNTNAEGSPAIAVGFNKETLDNYEVGVKTEFLDRRVRLNASVFYMKWKDLQMEAFRFLTPGDLSSNFEQTINIPKADAQGAELELVARATEYFTIGGNIGYLDTKIKENQACAVSVVDPDCVNGHKFSEISGGYKVNLQGLPIPKSPKVTASAFGEYRIPFGNNSGWLRAEFVHRDSQYSDIEALTNQQTLGPSPNQGLSRVVPANEFPYKVPSFDVVNLRGGFDWEKASLALYVQNVGDEKYYTGTQENFGLSGIRLRPHPRVFGANVTFRF